MARVHDHATKVPTRAISPPTGAEVDKAAKGQKLGKNAWKLTVYDPIMQY